MELVFDFPNVHHPKDTRLATVVTDGYSMSVPCTRGVRPEKTPQEGGTKKPLRPSHCLRDPARVVPSAVNDETTHNTPSAKQKGTNDDQHNFSSFDLLVNEATVFSHYFATNCWSASPTPIPAFQRPIGIDTGCTNIVVAAELLPQRHTDVRLIVRVTVLTRKEWRDAARAEEVLKTTTRWTAPLRETGSEYSKAGAFVRLAARNVCAKTADPKQHLRHMKLSAEVRDEIFNITLNPQWARLRFRTWSNKKKALWSFFAKLNAGRLEDHTASVQPMYAYGDAVFSPSGRGRMSVPTVAVYDALVGVAGKAAVCYVDEFRTSMKCFCCGNTLTNVVPSVEEVLNDKAMANLASLEEQEDGGEEKKEREIRKMQWKLRSPVRGVKICEYCSDFVDRDVSAALNILAAFCCADQGFDRPAHLRMLTGEEREAEAKWKKEHKSIPFILGKLLGGSFGGMEDDEGGGGGKYCSKVEKEEWGSAATGGDGWDDEFGEEEEEEEEEMEGMVGAGGAGKGGRKKKKRRKKATTGAGDNEEELEGGMV